MTTELLDSTVSTLDQDNSSVEYVAPETNPIATIPDETQNRVSANPLFDFNAVHNGVQCIESLDPKDRGTERQYRFTRALLCVLFGVKSENTITNHVESLVNRGAIDVVKNLTTSPMVNSNGASHETTLYDLKVFNYLVMRLDTDRAWEMKAKFNDVLVERETQTQSVQPTIYDYARALIAEKERNDALEAQNKALTDERDKAIRTKAMIGSRREATAMATASAKARECEKLREQIGDSETYKRATAIPWLSEYFDTRNDGLYNSIAAQLRKIESSMPPEFAHKPTPDTRYGSVKAYHIAVIEKFHELVREKIPVDKEFMSKYRKDVSPKTKNA